MPNPLVAVQQYGQSVWYDNIRRSLITSGQLQGFIEHDGLLGVTSNPAIFEKAIAGGCCCAASWAKSPLPMPG